MKTTSRKRLKLDAIKTLKKCQACSDPENAHDQADKALTGFLRAIGFPEISDEWDKVDKWYS